MRDRVVKVKNNKFGTKLCSCILTFIVNLYDFCLIHFALDFLYIKYIILFTQGGRQGLYKKNLVYILFSIILSYC